MSPQVLSLGDGGKWQIPGQMQQKTTVPPDTHKAGFLPLFERGNGNYSVLTTHRRRSGRMA